MCSQPSIKLGHALKNAQFCIVRAQAACPASPCPAAERASAMPRQVRQGPRGQAIIAARRAEEQWRRTVSEVLDRPTTGTQAQFRRQIALRGCPGRDGHLRRRLWLLLLGLEAPAAPEPEPELPAPDGMEEANLREQLQLDVQRSLHNFEERATVKVSGVPRTQAEGRAALLRLMASVLTQPGENLHYYQGFHGMAHHCATCPPLIGPRSPHTEQWPGSLADVSSVFLLHAGEASAEAMVDRVALSHLRYATTSDLASTREVMGLLYPLLGLVAPELYQLLLVEAEIEEPVFALSWLITWFAHDLQDQSQVCRLYDLFLALAHPLAALYFAVALVEHRGSDLLALDRPADFASCHHLLRSVPQVCTCRRLIDLSNDCIYMPAIDRSLSDCRTCPLTPSHGGQSRSSKIPRPRPLHCTR